MSRVKVADFEVGDDCPLAVIAGPCVIESEENCQRTAAALCKLFYELGVPFAFKSSYDKANRSSLKSYRGPGVEVGLRILEKIRDDFGVPVYTDVHTPEEAMLAGEVCEVLQIPAFLSRQTDLLVAAARTGKVVAIKKGQFMAPWDMIPAVQKVRESGNDRVIVIDRGNSFGYNNLVSDMRAMPIMKEQCNCPAGFDGTHAVQLPGGHGTHSGGQVEFVPPLSKAAVAAGADFLYLETHLKPAEALSDAGSQLNPEQLKELVLVAKQIREVVSQPVPCLG